MAAPASKRWYFSEEKFTSSPSRRLNINADKEESYRQQAANFIQDMGQRLQVTQLCINTAIVYMQRFYMFHSFTKFHRNYIAAAALFLAAKVEEQPRKLEHVIKVSYICLHRDQPQLDSKSEQYLTEAQELVSNENILLQTLGFDVAIDHPHTHVVKCCQLVKASKELAQTSYFMATNSLHLTTMCLRYPPTIVACVCIHLACKWSKYNIPISGEGKPWYSYVDATANIGQIEKLTTEFLTIFDKCPSRLKKKILQSHNDTQAQERERERDNTQGNIYNEDFTKSMKPAASKPHPSQAPVSSSQAMPGRSSSSQHAAQRSSSSQRPHAPNSSLPAAAGHHDPKPHPGHQGKPPPGYPHPPARGPEKQQRPGPAPPGHHPHAAAQQPPPPPGQHRARPAQGAHSRSHSQEPGHSGAKEAVTAGQHRELARQTARSSLPGGQTAPHGRAPAGHPQPPPYPKHHQPAQQHKSSASRIPSLFDLPDSPEKKPVAPPSYPGPGHGHLPPPYDQARPTYPGLLLPGPPLAPLAVQQPGPKHAVRPGELARVPSLEQGELLDTPTPTHIKMGFPYPASAKAGPAPPAAFPKQEKDVLPTFPSAIDQGSKLQQSLFDPDYDDFDSGNFDLNSLLSSSLADTKEESKARTDNFVSDLSSLFGDDSNPSGMMAGGFDFGNPSGTFKPEQTVIKHEVKQEVKPERPEVKPKAEGAPRLPSSPYKAKREGESSKRKPAPAPGQPETKKRMSSLFSPEPDSRPPAPGRPPVQASPTLRGTPPADRARTLSTGDSGGSEQPVVKVQKLESIAPEFERMLKDPSSSILVTADGQPSPRKRAEERRAREEREKAGAGGGGDNKRSSSGSSRPAGSSERERPPSSSRPPAPPRSLPAPPRPQPAPAPPAALPSTAAPPPTPLDTPSETGVPTPVTQGDKEHRKEKKEHKHKKDKKEKKDKKDKKDKREERSEKDKDSSGGEHKKHKKDKKHKRDRERSRERDTAGGGAGKVEKLTIKGLGGTPSMSPSREEGGDVAPHVPSIKIKIGGMSTKIVGQPTSTPSKTHHSASSQSSASKRKYTSSVELSGPAAKMARAMGGNTNSETKYLEKTNLIKQSGSSHEDKAKKAKSSRPVNE